MQTLLVAIVVIAVLILVHELGHYLVARRAGVLVHEFSIGFGPLASAQQRGETQFSLRWIPLGGYVRMAGMHEEVERQEIGDEAYERLERQGRLFSQKSLKDRMLIIVAGSAMNFLLAVVLFMFIFSVMGRPVAPTLTVAQVTHGFPAYEAEMQRGDRIISVDGQPVETWEELVSVVEVSAGRTLALVVERRGEQMALQVTPRQGSPNDPTVERGFIGIRPVMETERLGLLASVSQGMRLTWAVVETWALGLAGLTQGGTDGLELRGIVGIGEELGTAARLGLASLLFFTAFLSANLGLLNLLPIPALDGSRLVFLAVEGVRGHPLDPDKENFIHLVGFALLIMLFLVVTYYDILRLDLGGMG